MKCSQAGSCFFRLIGRSPTSSRSESEGEMSKAEQREAKPNIEPQRKRDEQGALYYTYSFANASNTGIDRRTFSVGMQ